MKWVKILFAVLIVLAAGVLGAGFLLPDRVHVERSIAVEAPPATVYTVLDGFRRFNEWSPWADLDPKAEYVYAGPPVGVGARMAWSSQEPGVGSGSQEIVEATPFQKIRTRLNFGDAPGGDSYGSFALTPAGEGTQVTWAYDADFHGKLMDRYLGLVIERMLAPDYEKGLARLKALVESLPKDDFSSLQVEVVQVPATPLVLAHGEAQAEQAGPLLGQLYARLQAFVAAAGLHAVSAPIAITRSFNDETHAWSFDAALPLDQPCTSPEDGAVTCATSYHGLALRATHKGPQADMEPTYNLLMIYKTVAGFADNGDSWEHYVTDPATTPPPELVTHIYWPIR